MKSFMDIISHLSLTINIEVFSPISPNKEIVAESGNERVWKLEMNLHCVLPPGSHFVSTYVFDQHSYMDL